MTDGTEFDGEVFISKEISLKKGQFGQVEIIGGAEELALWGKSVG
jgi:hypothetical protein